MNPPLDKILPLLNAGCGDGLKAALLHIYFPEMPKINPLWLKAPTGEIEAAFAAMRSATPESSRAERVLAEIKSDHAKIEEKREIRPVDPDVQRLVAENTTAKQVKPMPDGVRFDDVEVMKLPAPLADPAGEPSDEFITLETAMAEFKYSYAGIVLRLKNAGIKGVRRAGEGHKKYFPRSRVAAVCEAKGKRVQ